MRRKGIFMTAMIIAGTLLQGCASDTKAEAILSLGFDEGKGSRTVDATGNLGETDINYRYLKASYTENKDPEWRECGINAGSLLFDGNSTYLSYDKSDITLGGKQLSISVWVAPRAFEWDDPNAQSKGEQHLTAIVSQHNKSKKQGVILGYQRYGKVCFEVGADDGWHTVWGDTCLKKDEWNHLTAVYDSNAGEIKLYLNGKLTGSGKVAKDSEIVGATREKLLIGKNSDAETIAAGTYNMFSGLMDEVNIFKGALSEEEACEYSDVPAIDYDDIALCDILTDDIYKTQYHGGPYQHWMNEPHAPVYYNGMYHIFFQQNMVGTYWRNIQWGHLVSEDLVDWRPVKEAICATEDSVVPDGVWSGNAGYDKNGVPLLFFTAGNDSFTKAGLISNQNIGIAYPADLNDKKLTDWIIYDELAVKQEIGQGRKGEFRDPYIWKEGETWCMLICSGSSETNGGSALLYTTDRLELMDDGTIDMDWQYKGPVYEMKDQTATYGTSWELPILVPLTNKSNTITKYAFIISPAPASSADNKAYFFLGGFDVATGKFTPDEQYDNNPGLIDYGDNVFTGPSVMVDQKSGEVYLFSIMQDKRNGAEEGASGWAHSMGLTRQIWLSEDGTDICVKPIDELASYEKDVMVDIEENMSVEDANELLKLAKGDQLHIAAVIDTEASTKCGITVKSNGKTGTRFWYEDGKIYGETDSRGTEANVGAGSGEIELENGELKYDIYVDRSLVEAYINESKSISVRSYSDFEDQGINIFSDGSVTVKKLYVANVSKGKNK